MDCESTNSSMAETVKTARRAIKRMSHGRTVSESLTPKRLNFDDVLSLSTEEETASSEIEAGSSSPAKGLQNQRLLVSEEEQEIYVNNNNENLNPLEEEDEIALGSLDEPSTPKRNLTSAADSSDFISSSPASGKKINKPLMLLRKNRRLTSLREARRSRFIQQRSRDSSPISEAAVTTSAAATSPPTKQVKALRLFDQRHPIPDVVTSPKTAPKLRSVNPRLLFGPPAATATSTSTTTTQNKSRPSSPNSSINSSSVSFRLRSPQPENLERIKRRRRHITNFDSSPISYTKNEELVNRRLSAPPRPAVEPEEHHKTPLLTPSVGARFPRRLLDRLNRVKRDSNGEAKDVKKSRLANINPFTPSPVNLGGGSTSKADSLPSGLNASLSFEAKRCHQPDSSSSGMFTPTAHDSNVSREEIQKSLELLHCNQHEQYQMSKSRHASGNSNHHISVDSMNNITPPPAWMTSRRTSSGPCPFPSIVSFEEDSEDQIEEPTEPTSLDLEDVNPAKRVRVSDINVSRYEEEFLELNNIATGEYGEVKVARHRLDGMVYAIKVTRRPISGNTQERAAMNEVFAHAALMKHKHIVRYYNSWVENGRIFIQTEFCEGGSLANLIKQKKEEGKSFTENELKRILVHVAKGLQYIHSKNLVHLDIKPENIFVALDHLPWSPASSKDEVVEDHEEEDEEMAVPSSTSNKATSTTPPASATSQRPSKLSLKNKPQAVNCGNESTDSGNASGSDAKKKKADLLASYMNEEEEAMMDEEDEEKRSSMPMPDFSAMTTPSPRLRRQEVVDTSTPLAANTSSNVNVSPPSPSNNTSTSERVSYKIGDLGHVAPLVGDYIPEEGDCRYMAPELLLHDIDREKLPKADVFSLGLTIYECASLQSLPKNSMEDAVYEKLKAGELPYMAKYSKEFNNLVKSMVRPDMISRPSAARIANSSVLRSVSGSKSANSTYGRSNLELYKELQATRTKLRELESLVAKSAASKKRAVGKGAKKSKSSL